MIKVKTEKMSEMFSKFHVIGLPFGYVLHHFTSIADENAHDHPFRFTSFILKGGYTERRYNIKEDGTWGYVDIEREPGSSFVVEANSIHEIIDLPEGECWTAIMPESKVQEPAFYKFDETGAYKRYWYEKDWTKLEK